MKDYSVPQNKVVWTSPIPVWIAWTACLVIGGGLTELIAPYITVTLLDSSQPLMLKLLIYIILYSILFISTQQQSFRFLTGSSLVSWWLWLLAWLPVPIITATTFRASADHMREHIYQGVIGILIGLWVGAWLLKVLPFTLDWERKLFWISIHGLALGLGFFFFSSFITYENMGESKMMDTFAPIYYIAHAIKWLIYALPTGFLFQWMLQRQLKR